MNKKWWILIAFIVVVAYVAWKQFMSTPLQFTLGVPSLGA